MNHCSKLILALLPFLLYACNKDGNKSECVDSNTIVKTHNFNSAYYPHVMVYKNYDTIQLLKNSIDTILFFGDKIKNIDDILPARSGCGKESFRAEKQSFKSSTGDSIVLYYSKMLNYSLSIDQFGIIFRDTYFDQFAEYIVKCDSTLSVLGKSYCVQKMGVSGNGAPYIYYAKDDGLIKMFLNNDVYERIP